MNREEKLCFQKDTEEYFEQKRVYDLFEKLLKELIVNKPDSPIDYLIDRLKKKDTRKIFITGPPGCDRKEISLSLAEHIGFTCISLGDLIQKEIDKKLDNGRKIEKRTGTLNLVDDDLIIEILRKELIQLEKDNASYIIEGFPRNRVNIF
jgi:adenylate kinase